MFATLLGPLPRPPLPDDATSEALLEAALALQVEHGLEPLTAAGFGPDPQDPLATWQAATALGPDLLVKAVVVGPLSSGVDAAVARAQILALAEAGCQWIEIHEPAATSIDDDAGRAWFAEAHLALTAGLDGVHLSLAIIGGSAEALGIDAALAGAYSSLAVDLIDGPDNWRLVAAAPSTLGVIAGAMATRAGSDDGPELLLWAAGYAASTAGRGGDRVGLATAGSLAHLTWDVAAHKVERLGVAARLAQADPDDVRAAVDPRALDSRSAALGRYTKPPPRRRRTTIDR
ncbi:MAG: hypothetical protein ACSLFN_04555 [Candidatus Limnocylindrales bacterium]